MRRCCVILSIIASICSSTLFGQDSKAQQYSLQDSLVNRYSELGEFDSLYHAVQDQINFLYANDYADSAYKYTYHFGRSTSEMYGYEHGINETESFVSKVMATDSHISHHLTALSDMSWIYIEAGQDSMVMDADLRYYDLCMSYDNASPSERYLANYALGFDYELLGQGEQAIHYFSEAISAVLPDSLEMLDEIMDGYNGLGAAYWRNGNLRDAKDSFYESIRFSHYDRDTLNAYMYQANALGNLSLVYEDEGNLIKSKELLQRSLTIRQLAIAAQKDAFQRKQQTRQLIYNYHNLSALYLRLGDLERSRRAQEYCESLRRNHFPEDHHDHAKSYEAFGSIAYAEGDYPEALEQFETGLVELSKGFSPNSPYVIGMKKHLGKTYFRLAQHDKAIAIQSEAIDAYIAMTDPSTNQELAMAYYARSKPALAKGNLELAKQDLFKSRDIFSKTRDTSNFMFGLIYLDLARIHILLNKPDSAHYYLDAAIALENGQAKYGNQLQFLPEAYAEKAQLTFLENPEQIEDAVELALQGKSVIQHSRGTYEEASAQLNLYEQHSNVFDVALDLIYRWHELIGDANTMELFFKTAEERRSILLRNQLNKFSSLRVQNVPDSLIEKEQVLLKIILGDDQSTPDEILSAEQDYQTLKSIFEEEYPTYFKLRYNDEVVSLAEVQKQLLDENQTIIQYVTTNRHTYAVIITKEKSRIQALEASDVGELVKRLNIQITQRSADFRSTARELYDILFSPIEAFVSGIEIMIVADRGLFNLNFETLLKSDSTGEEQFLIKDYNFSYLLSNTTAYRFNELEHKSNHQVLAFAPGFTDTMKRAYLENLPDTVFEDQGYLHSIQQPFSVSTATELAQMFSGNAMVEENATEENFKELASNFGILHLGTHTEINNLSPLMSRFILSQNNDKVNSEDGYLHAYEIYNMPLRAELAVLTACETGLGKETSSEGVLSIAHSFAYAGCPSIVMSIWQIDEKSASDIITSFYSELKHGAKKNTALRNAKLTYLHENNGELAHPYYWSGLILVGNTDSVNIDSTSNWTPIFILLLIITSFGLILIRRNSRK